MNEFSTEIAYIHGRIQAQLESYADSMGIPTRQLARWMGEILLSEKGGKVLGTKDSVSRVSGKAKRRKAVAEVEVVERTSGKASYVRHKSKWTQEMRDAQAKRMRKRWRTDREKVLAGVMKGVKVRYAAQHRHRGAEGGEVTVGQETGTD